MHYVYLLRSLANPAQTYTGSTSDLKQRLRQHNAGQSTHTTKYKPWQLTLYFAFSDRTAAERFERYLKSGSGRAFANRHFHSP
jgi:putative endonuclease